MNIRNYYMLCVEQRWDRGKPGKSGKWIYELQYWITKPPWTRKDETQPTEDERKRWYKDNILNIRISKKDYEQLKKLNHEESPSSL